MVALSGQNVDDFMKEMEAVQKKLESGREEESARAKLTRARGAAGAARHFGRGAFTAAAGARRRRRHRAAATDVPGDGHQAAPGPPPGRPLMPPGPPPGLPPPRLPLRMPQVSGHAPDDPAAGASPRLGCAGPAHPAERTVSGAAADKSFGVQAGGHHNGQAAAQELERGRDEVCAVGAPRQEEDKKSRPNASALVRELKQKEYNMQQNMTGHTKDDAYKQFMAEMEQLLWDGAAAASGVFGFIYHRMLGVLKSRVVLYEVYILY
ncbi:hypothetical protein NQ318_006609 [Aromia moschata]|uniref:Uncharacterized protein n=1 Tax=Aromia moschata TaxID=1265417 RepID=A0AAV8XYQ3_9CUCU|nr:hypothetical protein NQ318_006609 [Aromia moschata]